MEQLWVLPFPVICVAQENRLEHSYKKGLEVQEKHIQILGRTSALASAASPPQQDLCGNPIWGSPTSSPQGRAQSWNNSGWKRPLGLSSTINPAQLSPAIGWVVALAPKKRHKSTSKLLVELSKFLTAFLWV